ncbi:HAD family hydrolase [Flavobacterium sp. LB1P71]|uniref:HAD family hydrolase n=1 Tax=unclassified Flavobacterium TaxID=196869 RepID=UPI003AB03E80
MKKAIILDLDNTIFSTPSIGDKLFADLYYLLEINLIEFEGDLENLKKDINRKPFSVVAKQYKMTQSLYKDALQLLSELTYNETIEPFPDYNEVTKIQCDKFLVTSGFPKLQNSKVKQLGIEKNFKGIYIVDTVMTNDTKKNVFKNILHYYNYDTSEVVVIGDDPESEITAAEELGIDAILYDKLNLYANYFKNPKISDFNQLQNYL